MPTIYKPKKQRNNDGDRLYRERRKVYNTERWKRLRAWKIANNPLCEMCLLKGIVTPAEDVHHMTSFMSTDDPDRRHHLAFDYENLQSICKPCHQSEHNKKG